ncbi:Protein argonaute-1 [Grifola frondosa]|uniref:Protein argonaute-1 n=1 Tax=Grifola frondosa TaxID=5627 RepID=A0A1C7MFX7_GRIFR|nr:Protein argonaute-1 [Grifola frondosa]
MEKRNVYTNSFEITRLPGNNFFHHHEIDPEIGHRRRLAFRIIEKMQQDNPAVFNPRALYDGRSNIFAPREIPMSNFDVQFSPRRVYKVNIRSVAEISPQRVQHLISPQGAKDPTALMAVNLLQIIVQQAPNLRHQAPLDSKSFYIQAGSRELGQGLQAWRGYFQYVRSVRPVIGRLLINIDVCNTAIATGRDRYGISRFQKSPQLLRLGREQAEWRNLRAFLKSIEVSISINRGDKPRVKKISDLILQAGHHEFEINGAPTTVQTYYQQRYNRSIKPELFGIRSGKDSVFPAELCTVVPGQAYKKKLPPELQDTLVKFATQRPSDRLQQIKDAVGDSSKQIFDYKNSDFMREAGISVSVNPVEISGHVLMPPTIRYGDSTLNVNRGAWNLIGRRFSSPSRISSWAVIVLDQHANLDLVEQFTRKLVEHMERLGICMAFILLHRYGVAHILHFLVINPDQRIPHFEQGSGQDPAKRPSTWIKAYHLHCDASEESSSIYTQVKQWGNILNMVPTQCLRAGKWSGLNDQYCGNIALKVNAKIGGINSTVQWPGGMGNFLQQTMVVGADVGHPGPGNTVRPSLTGVVASVNADATIYTAFSNIQEPRREIIDKLDDMMFKSLKDYYEFNKKLPSNIVFYRDGVSEGEYDEVGRYEITAVEEAIKKVPDNIKPPGWVPKLTFIVVGKRYTVFFSHSPQRYSLAHIIIYRHHIRFFPMRDHQNELKSGNCPAGFAVDDQITNAAYPDFYLLSHAGIQGSTQPPAHYVVLRNDNNLPMRNLQELSFALCHVYASATRSVSIPAPVYYADVGAPLFIHVPLCIDFKPHQRVCSRAEIHFNPTLNYADELVTTATAVARARSSTSRRGSAVSWKLN